MVGGREDIRGKGKCQTLGKGGHRILSLVGAAGKEER